MCGGLVICTVGGQRGSSSRSRFTLSHPFDDTTKAKIMRTLKTWGASIQKTVGQVISQIFSLTKPLSCHPVNTESQKKQASCKCADGSALLGDPSSHAALAARKNPPPLGTQDDEWELVD
ncbi:hypothetical protein VP01_4751g2 [Puccinia sorghi]|uniref:Uncharacterized protein n=1 Tax=Puccinia sorghi TaxID=27349 RepID=A0A0L6UMV6_9BASI|nr:hypothetical protein VP01_4751g2 [Puccinia sorghi]